MTLAVLPATATTAGGAKVFNQTSILATNVIGIAHGTTPFVSAYAWSAGFGSKYANPGTLPAVASYGISFAPNGSAVALGRATTTTTNLFGYPWSSGFGTRYLGTTVSQTIYQTAFSSDSAYVAAAGSATPYISILPWSNSGFGTKVSDPGTAPAGSSQGVSFKADALVVAHATSPFISGYPWSSSGFGTKYGDPGSAPAGTGVSIAFSPTGADIVVSHTTTPFVSAYPWSAGFGTKYGNPANVPPGNGSGVAFTRAGTTVAVAATTTPFVAAYPWSSSGFGTKYANPGTAVGGTPQANSNSITFAADDSAVALVHATSPYISAYPWDTTSGFGTKYSDPGSALAGIGYGVAFGTMYT